MQIYSCRSQWVAGWPHEWINKLGGFPKGNAQPVCLLLQFFPRLLEIAERVHDFVRRQLAVVEFVLHHCAMIVKICRVECIHLVQVNIRLSKCRILVTIFSV